MSFLIVFDDSFSNEYNERFFSVTKSKAKKIKESLECDFKVIEKKDLSVIDNIDAYLKNIYDMSLGYEDIIYIPSDMPLIDIEETLKLADIHKENIAYYSYGENYPLGIVPFIIRRQSFERLFSIIKNNDIKPSKDAITKLVFIDPNFFEIEILISKYDMRYYRLSLFADSKRNSLLVKRLIECENYECIVKTVMENPNIRRTLPAYIELDINAAQNVKRIESPIFSESKESMTLKDFKIIYEKLLDFAGDLHISIGSFYEPLINDESLDIVEYAIQNKNINVYLETNALLLSESVAKRLIALQKDNLYIIIHLDTVDEKVYKSIYESGDLKTTLSNIDYYLLREPKNAYLQITKQTLNFDYLASYYKYFERYKVNIIMQKYSTYRGSIKDYRVGDLSPLINTGCFHLARDLYIDVTGDIRICKYDVKKEIVFGNIFKDDISNIWNKCDSYYKDNVLKKLSFCDNCDDWYLYNF